MIKTVAHMLETLIEKEDAALQSQGIEHKTTLGGMYEDLTADVLERSVVGQRLLSVVSGFIVKPDGSDSKEFDCMLIEGQPQEIRRSAKVRCELSQVLAVIQVKKTLFGNTLTEGVDNLKTVRLMKPSCKPLLLEEVRRVFQQIARVPLPDDVSKLPPHLEMLYHHLVLARAYPACILLGYGGYSTHEGFRKGICDDLSARTGRGSYGPMSMPDLIVNRHFAAAKMTGRPWLSPMFNDWWPLIATSNMRPTALHLLEVIYTKLVQRGLANDSLFGEDLDLDVFTPLIDAQFDETRVGWRLNAHNPRGLGNGHDRPTEWSPVFLDDEQHVLMVRLCNAGSVEAPDAKDVGLTQEQLDALVASGLVRYSIEDPDRLVLLTTKCECLILPDGRFACGENHDGRLFRWLAKHGGRKKKDVAGEPPLGD